ncbi:hypothetical protein D9X30_1224 [Cupriavidus sp. U2]|uniref:hypothetical protein n=1 Tax=Cupriavidus sp. U2 TaxID=2920269 RepID=UPI001892CE5F|nr:hypothetical protein [Cupriavidus sp. U2]KAI3593497.1 hypothetical protein D9X30_1224 [Cupriavidus sp. U2]
MKSRLLLTGLAAVVLTACGGGGDGGNGGTATPAATTTKISGTAATGAAMANVTVTAKCASGGGSAVTAADGTFTISIDNASRPCVLSATAADGTVLHSVVEAGSGTSVTANVSPFTELLTAALAQGSTDKFFSQFDAAAQARLTASSLSTATDTVRLTLTGVVDLAGVDPLKGALVAANNGKPGNAMDQLLDQLRDRLATSRATVADLATAIGSNAGSEAIGTILKTASATCAGLRTGDYVLLAPGGTVGALSIDAKALTLTPKAMTNVPANVVAPLATVASLAMSPASGEACRFDVDNNAFSMLVSSAGIALAMPSAGTVSAPNGAPAVIVPVQQLSLAELAGNWNAFAMVGAGGASFTTARATFTLDANGKMTAGSKCNDDNACVAWTGNELSTITKQPGGYFLITDVTGPSVGVAFKGTDGQVTAVISQQTGLMIATKQVSRDLPVVGATNAYWDYVTFGDMSSQFTKASTRITSVDTVNGTYTRTRIEDNRLDMWRQNYPLTGLRYRARSVGADEAVQLTLGNTGIGVNLGLHVTKPYFDISVNRPK